MPATVLLVGILSFAFTLPPGPLCDEGMVLFMEGGCDWGESNVFFHSKLATMVALFAAFAVAWRARVKSWLAFVPHFCIAAWLAWATRSGGHCDAYYSHPNGSVGQMVVEMAAVGFLGLAILRRWSGGGGWPMIAAVIGWAATYVVGFYAALLAVPHWTWTHTVVVASVLILAGLAVSSRKPLRRANL